jgi:hypothetical protein
MDIRRNPMARARRAALWIPLWLVAAALAACGGGGSDDVVADPNVPGRPTLVNAVAGDAQATVTFTAPTSIGGSAITGYTVKSLPSGGVDSQAGTTALSHVITGLNNGTVYIFTVTATNSFGTSVASVSSNSVLPNTPTVPGAPTIGAAFAGDGQVGVTFTAPTTAGSAAITSYTATCGTATGTAVGSPIAVMNLVNGTAYTCTVYATNSAGNSAASAASNSVTPKPAPPVGALNDTGQALCFTGTAAALCAAANSGDTSTRPRQDARFGRDAMAVAGQLAKLGGGPGGFDFTKMCMSGQLAGTGTCALAPPTPANQAAATADQWACTRDHHTGLVWSMQTSVDTWANATADLPAAANAATRCGFNTGWRLPTRRELLSIVYNGVSSPSIVTSYFTGAAQTLSSQYWSNDPDASLAGAAWVVSFNNGAAAPADKLSAVGIAVRLVHGTVTPSAALTINADGTATDATTGLTWDRCSIGQVLDNGSCTGTAAQVGWSAALVRSTTANTASYKGFTDWRLPSKNELESLVDITKATAPVIDAIVFPNTPAAGSYWSSTPYGGPSFGTAWYQFFDHPLSSFNTMGALNAVRLVRGGAAADAFDGQAP